MYLLLSKYVFCFDLFAFRIFKALNEVIALPNLLFMLRSQISLRNEFTGLPS